MKIFWSWQSDTPKEIGRFFVRDALREAIEALKTNQELLEPNEREVAAGMTLDSDRQGVPGSPDLAATIFEKIEAADVFVADVTLVGATPDEASGEFGLSASARANASVAISRPRSRPSGRANRPPTGTR